MPGKSRFLCVASNMKIRHRRELENVGMEETGDLSLQKRYVNCHTGTYRSASCSMDTLAQLWDPGPGLWDLGLWICWFQVHASYQKHTKNGARGCLSLCSQHLPQWDSDLCWASEMGNTNDMGHGTILMWRKIEMVWVCLASERSPAQRRYGCLREIPASVPLQQSPVQLPQGVFLYIISTTE